MQFDYSTSLFPKNKVIASTLGGALATIAFEVAKNNGITLSPELSGAIATIIISAVTFASGYLTPDRTEG